MNTTLDDVHDIAPILWACYIAFAIVAVVTIALCADLIRKRRQARRLNARLNAPDKPEEDQP